MAVDSARRAAGSRRRRNQKKQVRSVTVPVFGVAVVLLMSGALMYWSINSKCAQLGEEIRQDEMVVERLRSDLVREQVSWSEKLSPDRIDKEVLDRGLEVHRATPEQVVRMNSKTGEPFPNQESIAKFRKPKDGVVVRTEDEPKKR